VSGVASAPTIWGHPTVGGATQRERSESQRVGCGGIVVSITTSSQVAAWGCTASLALCLEVAAHRLSGCTPHG
jgi:hypothetical protein